jgi:hypothetical protein
MVEVLPKNDDTLTVPTNVQLAGHVGGEEASAQYTAMTPLFTTVLNRLVHLTQTVVVVPAIGVW